MNLDAPCVFAAGRHLDPTLSLTGSRFLLQGDLPPLAAVHLALNHLQSQSNGRALLIAPTTQQWYDPGVAHIDALALGSADARNLGKRLSIKCIRDVQQFRALLFDSSTPYLNTDQTPEPLTLVVICNFGFYASQCSSERLLHSLIADLVEMQEGALSPLCQEETCLAIFELACHAEDSGPRSLWQHEQQGHFLHHVVEYTCERKEICRKRTFHVKLTSHNLPNPDGDLLLPSTHQRSIRFHLDE